MLTRRRFLHAFGLTFGGAALAACAPKVVEQTVIVEKEKVVEKPVEKIVEKVVKETVIVEATQPPAAPAGKVTEVTVQSGWWVDEPGHGYWGAVIKAFSEKPENADLKITFIPVETTPQDMLTAIAGGTAPDVYHTYGGVTGTFDVEDLAPRNVAIALDEFFETARYFKKDDYYPEQWEQKTWDGKIWGLPVTEGGPGGPAFSWHKHLFEKAGLDPEVPPTSWEQVLDFALKLTEYDANGNVDVEGFDPLDANGCCWPSWAMWYDSPGISEDKRTILFNQNHWADFLEFLKAVYQGIGVEQMNAHKTAWSYWAGGTKCGFPNAKRAMILNGYWQPGELNNTLADKSWEIGYAWPPHIVEGKKAMGFGGTHTLWMTSTCKNRQEAFRFMDFIMSVESNLINYNMRGGFVLSEPLLKVLDTTKYKGLDIYMGMRAEADKVFPPSHSSSIIGAEMNKLWNRAVQEAIYDEKTPKQALDDITAELQASLDEAWKARGG